MSTALARHWFDRIRWLLAVIFIAIGSLLAMTSLFAATFQGTIASSDPTMTGRLLRNGIASTCANGKGNPGLNDTTAGRHYDVFTYTNSSAVSQCIVITFINGSGGTNLYSAAYLNTFDPSSVSSNYLADAGASGGITPYSFTLDAGQTAVIVVHEVSVNGGLNTTYTIELPVAQTISFDPIDDVTYGDPPFPLSATASSGLTVTFTTNTPTICTTAGMTVTLVSVGTCEIAADQAGNSEFMPAAQVTETFEVLQASLVVTVDDHNRAYGVPNPSLTGTLMGVVAGDVITASYATTPTETTPPGSYAIVATLNDPDNKLANYSVTNTPGVLGIDPAPLTVAADDAQRTFGEANPTFTANFSGFVNNESVADLDGTLVLTTTAEALSPTGTYPIVPSGLSSSNYDIAYENGELTIIAGPEVPIETVTITPEGQLTVGQSITFTADAGNATNVEYQWDFGDSQLSVASPVTTHVYTIAGTYTVTVLASNSANSMSASTTVTIANPTALDEVEQPGNPTQIFIPNLHRQKEE